MKYILLTLMMMTFFGCGAEDTPSTGNETSRQAGNCTHNAVSERTVNIYIHGYDQEGEKETDTYGNDESDEVLKNIAKTTGYATMENYKQESNKDIIVMTDYYGKNAPEYYSPEDRQDIDNVKEGIPRYALIVAKYVRHILKVTKTQNVNIISASMGTLVSRYLIEKNLENLSSEKKIKKWLSFEGVIHGNIAASKEDLKDILDIFKPQPVEVEQMQYKWVKKNLNINSPYFNNIQIGFESSTNDDLSKKALTKLLLIDGGFDYTPNDGVQAVKDTFFKNPCTHVLFHETHSSLVDNMAVWGFAATFLTSKKHVRITLTEAVVTDLHERLSSNAEIVFESSVHSLKAQEKWNFEKAIDERLLDSGYLKRYKYKNAGDKKALNQVVFNSYILDSEDKLTLEITPYELDLNVKYGVKELSDNKKESLGKGTSPVPMKNGTYEISGADWRGKVKVEVDNY